MARRPKHPKPDQNQAYNNNVLRQCGLVVIETWRLGSGYQPDDDTDPLDCYVGDPFSGKWAHVDWKVEDGRLTDRQQRYLDRYGKQLDILFSVTPLEVLRHFGRLP